MALDGEAVGLVGLVERFERAKRDALRVGDLQEAGPEALLVCEVRHRQLGSKRTDVACRGPARLADDHLLAGIEHLQFVIDLRDMQRGLIGWHAVPISVDIHENDVDRRVIAEVGRCVFADVGLAITSVAVEIDVLAKIDLGGGELQHRCDRAGQLALDVVDRGDDAVRRPAAIGWRDRLVADADERNARQVGSRQALQLADQIVQRAQDVGVAHYARQVVDARPGCRRRERDRRNDRQPLVDGEVDHRALSVVSRVEPDRVCELVGDDPLDLGLHLRLELRQRQRGELARHLARLCVGSKVDDAQKIGHGHCCPPGPPQGCNAISRSAARHGKSPSAVALNLPALDDESLAVMIGPRGASAPPAL